mmetsp:Transcript_43101/g.80252  ORF Transcript_43101/g.80252 Transcript_43101/m.80252 type:complete len:423 (-) Transcript_43101:98-1366(-)
MAFLGKLHEQYSELWRAIIRPPRDTYEIKDLGPTVFSIENRTYQRTDLPLKNSRGHNLVCSHFEPIPSERVAERLPCVIYLHGNCSSRLEAVSTLPVLLPFNITVFCFDFSGSGLSDGEYLSLGFYERDDLAVVVNYLRESNRVTCIGLWGRSMGASTALLHADRDPSIAGVVLDSPFSDLKVLCEELVDVYVNFKIPRWVVGIALHMVRSSIKQHAAFDIFELAPIQHVKNSFIPALFTAAYNDTFIRPHHAKELHEAYAGDKNFVMVEGDHNSARSKFFMDSVAIFFFNTLQCDQLPHQHALPRGAAAMLPGRGGGHQASMAAQPRQGAQDHASAPRDPRASSSGARANGVNGAGLRMQAPDRVAMFTQAVDGSPALNPGNIDDEDEMVKEAIRRSQKDFEGGGKTPAAGNRSDEFPGTL